jgi:serine/threonine-protein kinase
LSQDLRAQLQATLSGTHTLGSELTGGGMSKVFVADETRLGRKVVVKVLSPELAEGLSVDRFEREIRTAAALQQANIVPVLSAGDTNGLPFYMMPFVAGEPLTNAARWARASARRRTWPPSRPRATRTWTSAPTSAHSAPRPSNC